MNLKIIARMEESPLIPPLLQKLLSVRFRINQETKLPAGDHSTQLADTHIFMYYKSPIS